MKHEKLSSAQAIVASLVDHGVDCVFGIPGAHTYELIDAIYARRDRLRFIVTRHEQGAAYMAYGYAMSTGGIGVYTCVPGPGLLNTTAALCTAYAGGARVLCLTSEIPAAEIGRGHGILHELPDQLNTVRLLTKAALRINHPTEASSVMADAFYRLRSGRPGPVVVECPWDTLGERAFVEVVGPREPAQTPAADPQAAQRAAELIAQARRPMIMVGGGAFGAQREIQELSQLLQAPVVAHRSGRGILADDAPLALTCGSGFRPWLESDLLVAIGTRMELQYLRWKIIPEGLRIVRIDIDPLEMSRRPATVGLVTDAAAGARALIDALRPLVGHRPSRADEFIALKARARKEFETVRPQVGYLDAIREALPRDGFLVEEISQMGFTARFAFPVYTPRTYVSSGYQDNLGFGFMTALGVKVANPGKVVISINGDGGFLFGVQELATAAQHGIGVIALVFNNRSFGNVLRDQKTRFGGHVIGAELQNPDFVKLAQSFGISATRAAGETELSAALGRAIAAGGPALIEIPGEPGGETSPWTFLHPAAPVGASNERAPRRAP
jgi:acetolactate synthase-1/2/3 large subunit